MAKSSMTRDDQIKKMLSIVDDAIRKSLSSNFICIDYEVFSDREVDPVLIKEPDVKVLLSERGISGINDGGKHPVYVIRLESEVVKKNRTKAIETEGGHKFYMPSWYPEFKTMIEEGENVFLVGPTGCGKTTMCSLVAKELGRSFFRMNLNGETTYDNFVGSVHLTNKQTIFKPGILTQAMEQGGIFLADEVDSAQPEVLFTMHSVLEGSNLILYEDGARKVSPAKGFVTVAAANTLGRGDDSGLYAGTNILNEAFLDRFSVVYHMEYSEHESDILKAYCEDSLATRLVSFAGEMRRGLSDNKILTTMSTRRLIELARKAKLWGVYQAFNHVIMSRVNTDDKEIVFDIAKNHGLVAGDKSSEKVPI